MEHIKQQIESLREQANALATTFGGEGITSHITLKLINHDGSEYFTEQEAEKINQLMQESAGFDESSRGSGYDGKVPWFWNVKNANLEWSFVVRLTVKETPVAEIDRLKRRLAELEGVEQT